MKYENFKPAEKLVKEISELDVIIDKLAAAHDVYIDSDGYPQWYVDNMFDDKKNEFFNNLILDCEAKIKALKAELEKL